MGRQRLDVRHCGQESEKSEHKSPRQPEWQRCLGRRRRVWNDPHGARASGRGAQCRGEAGDYSSLEESGVQEPSWVREEYGRAAGEVWGAPACGAGDPNPAKASGWGTGEAIEQCLRGFRRGRDSSLRWQSRGSAHRCLGHPQLSCLSPSPAGTGFCSPPGRLVPADWPTPVSSPTQPISVWQCFHLGVRIKGLE